MSWGCQVVQQSGQAQILMTPQRKKCKTVQVLRNGESEEWLFKLVHVEGGGTFLQVTQLFEQQF